MATVWPSKTVIDRAGQELAGAGDPAVYDSDTLAILDGWRRMHAEQRDWVAQTVRRRLRRSIEENYYRQKSSGRQAETQTKQPS